MLSSRQNIFLLTSDSDVGRPLIRLTFEAMRRRGDKAPARSKGKDMASNRLVRFPHAVQRGSRHCTNTLPRLSLMVPAGIRVYASLR